MRQRRREVRGVLRGARADLEHALPIGEHAAQHLQNRIAIALAGVGEPFQSGVATRLRSWKESSSRKRKVSRKVMEPAPCSSVGPGAANGAALATLCSARRASLE